MLAAGGGPLAASLPSGTVAGAWPLFWRDRQGRSRRGPRSAQAPDSLAEPIDKTSESRGRIWVPGRHRGAAGAHDKERRRWGLTDLPEPGGGIYRRPSRRASRTGFVQDCWQRGPGARKPRPPGRRLPGRNRRRVTLLVSSSRQGRRPAPNRLAGGASSCRAPPAAAWPRRRRPLRPL